jgi:hypothetical protein
MKKLIASLALAGAALAVPASQASAQYMGEPIPDYRMHVVITPDCFDHIIPTHSACVRWIRADGTPRQGGTNDWVREAPLSSYCGPGNWTQTFGWSWYYGHSTLSGVKPDGNQNPGCTFLNWTITELS